MFRRFMMGRYGSDQLNTALLVIALLAGIISTFFRGTVMAVLSAVQLILLAYGVFRIMSRDFVARRRENDAFLRFWYRLRPMFRSVSSFFARLRDRQHKYFKCPNCKSRLRVPRGRGVITITCPRCSTRFDRKS